MKNDTDKEKEMKMKRFSLLFFGLLAAVLALVTACPGGPEKTQDTNSGPAWRLVFFDDFNRSDGLLQDANWTVYRTNGLTQNCWISNNKAVFTGLGSEAIFDTLVPYDKVRVTAKILTPENFSNISLFLELRFHDPASNNFYSVGFANSNIAIYTNVYDSSAKSVVVYHLSNTNYVLEAIIDGYVITGRVWDASHTVMIAESTFTDVYQSSAIGKYGIYSYDGRGSFDDFTVEAWY